MQPPKDVSGFELFEMLSQVPRTSVKLPFPKTNPETGLPYCEFSLVMLSDAENMAAITASERAAKEALKGVDIDKDSMGYQGLFTNILVAETLHRAMRHPDDITRPFFPNRLSIQKVLSSDEIAVLFRNYVQYRSKFGPIISELSNDELEEWVEKLSEGGESGSFLLDQFLPEALKELIVYMAYRLHNSKTDIT